MKDKYGVEINVGDIVRFFDPDSPMINPVDGKVTSIYMNGLRAIWNDTGREQSASSSEYVVVVKPAASIPAEQPTGFTQEDESMLQMLLKRKQDHEAKLSIIEYNFEKVVSELDDQLTYTEMFDYLKVKSNAEELISVLKAYHEIN